LGFPGAMMGAKSHRLVHHEWTYTHVLWNVQCTGLHKNHAVTHRKSKGCQKLER